MFYWLGFNLCVGLMVIVIDFGRFCYLENVFIVPPWFSLSDRVQLDIVGMSFVNKSNIFNWLRFLKWEIGRTLEL